MSSKPETNFYRRVHKLFGDKLPHFEKMHNPYRSGTWDFWYSGVNGDLWVEYKWVPKWPKDGKVMKSGLSALQLDWGISRAMEGRSLLLVIGGPGGALMFDWMNEWETVEFRIQEVTDLHDVATEILLQVGEKSVTSKSSARSKNRRIRL